MSLTPNYSTSLLPAAVSVVDINTHEPDFRTLTFFGSNATISFDFFDKDGRVIRLWDGPNVSQSPSPFVVAFSGAISLRKLISDNGSWGYGGAQNSTIPGIPDGAVGLAIRVISGSFTWNYQKPISDVGTTDAGLLNPPTVNSPYVATVGNVLLIGRVPGGGQL